MSSITEKVAKTNHAPTIDEIMKAAHRERNEAIRQLFGFGFTAVKDVVVDGLAKRSEPARKAVAGS
jgi:hypothetical protein